MIDESNVETSEIPSRLVHISVQLFSSNIIAEYAMEKCHLIEVILSCIWHMFVPSVDQDKPDDDDDESILKTHPLACMYQLKYDHFCKKLREFNLSFSN